MKRKFNYILFLLLLLSILWGCQATKHELSNGNYTVMTEQESTIFSPRVTFELDTKRFSFVHQVAISYVSSGTFAIKKDKVIATTYDGHEIFTFKIVDNNTLMYIQEGSKVIAEHEHVAKVEDGTIFKLNNTISSGTYVVDGNKIDIFAPSFTFNVEDNSFVFTFDPLSSFLNTGKFNIENNRIIAKTSFGNKFIFEIKDEKTISYVQTGSSYIKTREGKTSVIDKTTFILVDR